jgi:hypothetical protein
MLPTSTLPISPFVGDSGMGLLVGVLAVGGFVALLIGYAIHRREQRRAPRVEIAGVAADADSQRRLSA